MKCKQGEIWWIAPSPLAIGSEQQRKRPALVLQNDMANKYLRTTIVALISASGAKDLPEMLPLGVEDGLSKTSYADFAQIYTVDQTRLEQKVGRVASSRWNEVVRALERIFYKTLG